VTAEQSVGSDIWVDLDTGQRDQVRAVWRHTLDRHTDEDDTGSHVDEGAVDAAGHAVRSVFGVVAAARVKGAAPATVEQNKLEASMVFDAARDRLDRAQRDLALALAAAQALAAVELAGGATEAGTARRLGVARPTVRRWFGKQATPPRRG
jgi:hypothetical protein